MRCDDFTHPPIPKFPDKPVKPYKNTIFFAFYPIHLDMTMESAYSSFFDNYLKSVPILYHFCTSFKDSVAVNR